MQKKIAIFKKKGKLQWITLLETDCCPFLTQFEQIKADLMFV